MMLKSKPRRPGLTLIETIVNTALLAIGLLALLPTIVGAQQKNAAQVETLNNLRQIGLATQNVEGTYGRLPPAFGTLGRNKDASVFFHLLPFAVAIMDDKKIEPDASFFFYLSPEEPNEKKGGTCNFAANLRVFSSVGVNTEPAKDINVTKEETFDGRMRLKSITDGTSNVISFAAKYGLCAQGGSKWASKPLDKTAPFFGLNAATEKAAAVGTKSTYQLAPKAKDCVCSPPMAQSFSNKGLAVCLADASSRIISPAVSVQTWNWALCPIDGNKLGDDWSE